MIYDRRNNVTIEETITCFAKKMKKSARNIMYYTNVYTAPVFDSSMGACSWQTSKAAECRAEIEALEGDFHLVGRLAGWANGVGGVCIGVTGLPVVEGLVRLATV